MNITPELVQTEIDYRLERARSAAMTREARKARKARREPSRLRRWLTGSERTPVRRPTPALP